MSRKPELGDHDRSGEDSLPTGTPPVSKHLPAEAGLKESKAANHLLPSFDNEEEKPLVPKLGQQESQAEKKYPTDSFTGAILPFLKVAFPHMLAILMERGIFLISVGFLANLDQPAGTGMALGEVGVRGFGVATLYGSVYAFDTLASQALKAQNNSMVHIYHQRAIFITMICYTPFLIIFGFYAQILKAAGIDDERAANARNYACLFIPGLFFMNFFECTRRYLQCFGHSWPSTVSTAFTLPFHILWCYIFIYHLNLLEKGAGIAMSLTWFLSVIVILFIKKKWQLDEGVKQPWSFTSFCSHLRSFSWPGLLGCLHHMIDLLSIYITMYEAGILGIDENSAHIILLCVALTFSTTGHGIEVATTKIVGYFIRIGEVSGAKLYALAAMLWSVFFACLIIIILNTLNHYLSLIFTQESDIIDIAASAFPYASITVATWLVCMACLGLARGLGLQKESFIISGASNIVGVAVGYSLAFHTGLGLSGLWIGWLSSMILAVSAIAVMLIIVDWNSLATNSGK